MKRDWELIRMILLEIESWECTKTTNSKELSEKWGIEEPHVIHNLNLTVEAGLIVLGVIGDLQPMWSGCLIVPNPRLTHEGHEFLDSAKDEGVWNWLKEKVGDKIGNMSFEVIKSLLVEGTKKMLLG